MKTICGKTLCENCFAEISSEPCSCCGFSSSSHEYNSADLPVGTVLCEKYIIGGVIGKGGFGITYLAYDQNLDRKVAVKEYYPFGLSARTPGTTSVFSVKGEDDEVFHKGAEKFYTEARLVAKFSSNENIVSVYDVFRENDTVYYVMDFLDGCTVKNYIKAHGPLPPERAAYIARMVANALTSPHKANVLHRDISPENIMLCGEDVRLIDFGAARQLVTESSQSLSVILKQGFAPLEQYQRKGKQGPWTDIYALGATLYYMLTGECLDDPMSRLEDDSEFLSNPHGIAEPLWSIIQKATALKSTERYQDAESIIADLEAYARGDKDKSSSKHTRKKPKPPKNADSEASQKKKRSVPIKLIAIFAAAAAVIGIAFAVFNGTGKEAEKDSRNISADSIRFIVSGTDISEWDNSILFPAENPDPYVVNIDKGGLEGDPVIEPSENEYFRAEVNENGDILFYGLKKTLPEASSATVTIDGVSKTFDVFVTSPDDIITAEMLGLKNIHKLRKVKKLCVDYTYYSLIEDPEVYRESYDSITLDCSEGWYAFGVGGASVVHADPEWLNLGYKIYAGIPITDTLVYELGKQTDWLQIIKSNSNDEQHFSIDRVQAYGEDDELLGEYVNPDNSAPDTSLQQETTAPVTVGEEAPSLRLSAGYDGWEFLEISQDYNSVALTVDSPAPFVVIVDDDIEGTPVVEPSENEFFRTEIDENGRVLFHALKRNKRDPTAVTVTVGGASKTFDVYVNSANTIITPDDLGAWDNGIIYKIRKFEVNYTYYSYLPDNPDFYKFRFDNIQLNCSEGFFNHAVGGSVLADAAIEDPEWLNYGYTIYDGTPITDSIIFEWESQKPLEWFEFLKVNSNDDNSYFKINYIKAFDENDEVIVDYKCPEEE